MTPVRFTGFSSHGQRDQIAAQHCSPQVLHALSTSTEAILLIGALTLEVARREAAVVAHLQLVADKRAGADGLMDLRREAAAVDQARRTILQKLVERIQHDDDAMDPTPAVPPTREAGSSVPLPATSVSHQMGDDDDGETD